MSDETCVNCGHPVLRHTTLRGCKVNTGTWGDGACTCSLTPEQAAGRQAVIV